MPRPTDHPITAPSQARVEKAARGIGAFARDEGWDSVYLADMDDGSPTRPGRAAAAAALTAAGVGELEAEIDQLRQTIASLTASTAEPVDFREAIYQAWHGTDEPWGGCADRERIDRVVLAVRAESRATDRVRAILDRPGPEVDGPEHDDWVWLDDAEDRLRDITLAVAPEQTP